MKSAAFRYSPFSTWVSIHASIRSSMSGSAASSVTVRPSTHGEGEAGHEACDSKPHNLVSRYQRPESAVLAAISDPIPAAQHRCEKESSCRHLEDLIAPSLCVFDSEPPARLDGKQGRIGLDFVEEASDVAVPHHPLALMEQRRHCADPVGKPKYRMGPAIDVAKRGSVTAEAV